MQNISIPSRLWYENEEWALTFPDRWQVDNLNPPGFEKAGLTASQIREKIDHPLSGPPWRNSPGGKSRR